MNDSRYNKYYEVLPKTPPFIQRDAALSILRAADLMAQQSTAIMKNFDLTPAQFNVLRILRGSPDGLACGQISERMIHRDPDITRLLDRMETRDLIVRCRGSLDRRVVNARISQKGLALLDRVDPLIHELHLHQFQAFTPADLHQLIHLIQQISKA